MTRFICLLLLVAVSQQSLLATELARYKKGQKFAGLTVQNLYSDSDGKIVGAKFVHISTGTPVFLLQIESVPQVLTCIDTPIDSNEGLPHSLEHLFRKGKKGRYFELLQEMRLDQSGAYTSFDFVCYGLSSGSGVDGFFESFHALLDTIYRPDFTDLEAAREFYHFGVSSDQAHKRTLVEQGTVYDEQRASQNRYIYNYELNKRIFGPQSPFAFDSGGAADEMRTVTPEQIRRFHNKYYRLGPNTTYIFAFPPQESVPTILQRIARELQWFSRPGSPSPKRSIGGPKYLIRPSKNLDPEVYPFPGANMAAPGYIHFAWRPGKAVSPADLKLLEILCGTLADGEDSLLQKVIVDSKTRLIDSGATGVDFGVYLKSSPFFPMVLIEVAGVAGNRITVENIAAVRNVIVDKIREVSKYPDHSEALMEFNRSIESYTEGLHRSERVWTKNAPGFQLRFPKNDWKTQFERLAMDNSFVQSVSEEPVWQSLVQQLKSGKNIWRDVIDEFHLAEIPYATATAPSPKLLREVEDAKEARIQEQVNVLEAKYHTDDEQEALSKFDQDEQVKTKEIDKLASSIHQPHFTAHAPLIPDEQVQYRQFEIQGVPVTASFFDSPPTIDLGLSFDLRRVPSKYFKYLPLFVHCIDSLGLNKSDQVTTYSDLRGQIQRLTYAFSTGYESNPVSKRADFTIRSSAATVQDARSTLDLVQRLMKFNYLDVANVDRLRDLVASDVAADDWYVRQDVLTLNAGYSFRYEEDPLFFALWSRPTRSHWDARLKWLLHASVDGESIGRLETFANTFLSLPAGISKQDLAKRLDAVEATGLERELVEYWKKNLSSFPESELVDGFRQLAREVHEDLQDGPKKTIEDLKSLQRIVLDRRGLHVDLTLSHAQLTQMESDIANFLNDLSSATDLSSAKSDEMFDVNHLSFPVARKLRSRYQMSQHDPPQYIGLINANRLDSNVVFYTDSPSYSELDRQSLVRVLASKIFSGRGPQTFFTKTSESGLAYDNGIASDPRWNVIWYTANRVPNIAALIKLVNATASTSAVNDSSVVDYVLSKTFAFSRTAATFSERGRAMAQDLRDGNDPATIRRFSEAVLQLSREPGLSKELSSASVSSICGVLLRDDCKSEQKAGNSLFFFMGPEKALSDAERSIPIPKLLRAWPSDYWIQ